MFFWFTYRYLLAIESREELEEYLSELLDGNEPRHKKFIRELLTKWRPPTRQIDAPVNLQVDVYPTLAVYPISDQSFVIL